MTFIPGQQMPVRQISDEQFAAEQARLAEEQSRPAPVEIVVEQESGPETLDVSAVQQVPAEAVVPTAPETPEGEPLADPQAVAESTATTGSPFSLTPVVETASYSVRVGTAVVIVNRDDDGRMWTIRGGDREFRWPDGQHEAMMRAASEFARGLANSFELDERARMTEEAAYNALVESHRQATQA